MKEQLDIEERRTMAVVEAAIHNCDEDGGDIHKLAYCLMRASALLFAEVFDVDQLEQMMAHTVEAERVRREKVTIC